MDKIILKKFRCYAYHGCLPEEAIIGSHYIVILTVHANLVSSCVSDSLNDTVDYVVLSKIIKEEMTIRSKLLEPVAHRILRRIFEECFLVKKATISVSKVGPPINADVERVSIKLSKKRGV